MSPQTAKRYVHFNDPNFFLCLQNREQRVEIQPNGFLTLKDKRIASSPDKQQDLEIYNFYRLSANQVAMLDAIRNQVLSEPRRFDMGHWARNTSCGTTYCLTGWLWALYPNLRADWYKKIYKRRGISEDTLAEVVSTSDNNVGAGMPASFWKEHFPELPEIIFGNTFLVHDWLKERMYDSSEYFKNIKSFDGSECYVDIYGNAHITRTDMAYEEFLKAYRKSGNRELRLNVGFAHKYPPSRVFYQ